MQREITYMFVVLIFDALVHKNIYNPQRSWEIDMDYVYIKLCSDWGNIATCPAYLFHATDTVPKSTVTVAGPRQHWTTDNLPEWYVLCDLKSQWYCMSMPFHVYQREIDMSIWGYDFARHHMHQVFWLEIHPSNCGFLFWYIKLIFYWNIYWK